MGGSSCIPKLHVNFFLQFLKRFDSLSHPKNILNHKYMPSRFDLKKTLEIDLEKGDLPNFPLKMG